jgi:site-specific DNA-cytosine methylase
MSRPVALDLCCGLGGWTAGLLFEGWDVIGFDIERHEYGDKRYPAHLILESILNLNGHDWEPLHPSLVVASPPCQEYSLWGMRTYPLLTGVSALVMFLLPHFRQFT